MDPRGLLARLARGEWSNVRFADVRRLVEAFGFQLRRVSGSHHIFAHAEVDELVNLQQVRGQAKPYGIRQFLRLIALRSSHQGGRMRDYHINVFYSEEDDGYIADVPDLEACSAFGSSPEEAVREVQKAKEAWLAAAIEDGRPVTPPRYRPALYTG